MNEYLLVECFSTQKYSGRPVAELLSIKERRQRAARDVTSQVQGCVITSACIMDRAVEVATECGKLVYLEYADKVLTPSVQEALVGEQDIMKGRITGDKAFMYRKRGSAKQLRQKWSPKATAASMEGMRIDSVVADLVAVSFVLTDGVVKEFDVYGISSDDGKSDLIVCISDLQRVVDVDE